MAADERSSKETAAMRIRPAFIFSILALLTAGGAFAERYHPGAPQASPSASPSPSPTPGEHLTTLEQRQMSIGEMVEFFSDLKLGTALRLTYSNGSDFAGNFDGREPGRALIYCRRGFGARRQVPLRKVMDAYVIMSSTLTVRVHQKNFPWRDR
jgi:hypothetical protein